MQDIIFLFQWWLIFLAIGFIFFPLASVIFKNFFDKGYIFSKIIGIVFISYFVFILGTFKLLRFDQTTIFLIIWILLLVNIYFFRKTLLVKYIKNNLFIYVFEELLFLLSLSFWVFVKTHEPSIHGLEKYMDYGFINSILRADYFPPRDMWFPPFSINYYYFGHFIAALLTKLSYIPSNISFNLMLSTIFAFTFTGTFSIGVNLIHLSGNMRRINKIAAGFLTAFLVTFAGNLHTIYTFFKPYSGEYASPFWTLPLSLLTFPNSYWYPNATRFIHNTIHEFPIYSFVVSDLHGHVLDIPMVLLTIAVLLSFLHHDVISSSLSNGFRAEGLKDLCIKKILRFTQNDTLKILLIGFLLAIMYMTNAWDGIIYFLLAFLILFYIQWTRVKENKIKNIKNLLLKNWKIDLFIRLFVYLFIIGIAFIIFTLPFNLYFKPTQIVSGIGFLCAPDFLTKIGRIGPFLFEVDHCQHSPWWQLMILYGFFYFWVISFIILIRKKLNDRRSALETNDIFVLILILLSTFLIIVPEFVYAKDIYPAHFRANTMFKLVYQSFIMLSITSAYIIIRIIFSAKTILIAADIKKKIFYIFYLVFSVILFSLVSIYPIFAINSYFGDIFSNKKQLSLDGTVYLKNIYPTDYDAILWINKNIKGSPREAGQPVILEAQGDSYTDYARVSANTGLPTVLGWTVHEWLWRGSYDIPSPRINDVQTLYETEDLNMTKKLIRKYNIKLVFIGDLERQKYTKLNEDKFQKLGKIIYENGQTIIYKLGEVSEASN